MSVYLQMPIFYKYFQLIQIMVTVVSLENGCMSDFNKLTNVNLFKNINQSKASEGFLI